MSDCVQRVSPIVETSAGKLRGLVTDGIACFKGIPFAAAPFGANHLRPPQPVRPWSGVRDALRYGPKPPQAKYPPGIAAALAEVVGPGEDCLTLNVWTADCSGKHPVMVFIPGGMFEFHATGGTAYYDGSRFARDGVVCVTLGYRVGAEGFLYLNDGVANLGLLDQIAALQWVQHNIASFGGDATNVTIFGESAGGMSAATLLAMPRAKRLFHRAIVQSGNTPIVNTATTAQRIGRRLAALVGVGAARHLLAAERPERLLQAQAAMREDLLTRPDPDFWAEVALTYLPWAPTVDGDTLPLAPIEAIRGGAAADIDVLVGSNVDETRLFLLADGTLDRITAESLSSLATAYGLSPDGLRAYRRNHPDASAGDLFSMIQTDWYWRIPAVRFADAHSSHARAATYMYEFAWPSPQSNGRLGAAHAVELPFVFDTLGLGTEPMLGPNPPQALADEMHRAWVAFAARGQCGWPRYDAARRATMRFAETSGVVDDPLGATLALWNVAAAHDAPAGGGTLRAPDSGRR